MMEEMEEDLVVGVMIVEEDLLDGVGDGEVEVMEESCGEEEEEELFGVRNLVGVMMEEVTEEFRDGDEVMGVMEEEVMEEFKMEVE